MRKKSLPLIALLLVSIILSACQLLPEEETLPPMPVLHAYEAEEYAYVTVMRGDLASSVTVRVTYRLTQQQQLSFPIDGLYIDSVAVTNGQQVQKGELLASLEQKELQPQLESQRYEVNVLYKERAHLEQMLELELARYDDMLAALEQELQQLQAAVPAEEDASSVQQEMDALLQQKQSLEQDRAAAQSICDSKVDAVNDSIYVASLRLNELESALEERQLIAGIDGVITFLQDVKDGQRSKKGETFITVSNLESAAFMADPEFAEYFPVGTDVIITCGEKDYEATVVDTAELGIEEPDTSEPASIYFKLKQPDPSLAENARGTVTLTLDRRSGVLYVHQKAIQTANGETFVYLLDEDGLRTMRSVTVGLKADNFVEIVTGLNEGDRVIVE